MEMYFSSVFGYKAQLCSFQELIESLKLRGIDQQKDYDLIREKYEEKASHRGYMLASAGHYNLLADIGNELEDISTRAEDIVSRSEGFYEISRKISPLQRLFTGRVLRDFDLRLTETMQQTAHRKKLYEGRAFRYEGIRYLIIKDNGGDLVMAEELAKGSRTKGKGIRLSGNKRTFAIEELKVKIKRASEEDTYWLE